MFDVRFDWGVQGLEAIGGDATVVIVDVLCFTTCVAIACSRGAVIHPCRWDDAAAVALADRLGAVLARKRGEGGFTLSPPSFFEATAELRIVLPSPNGSTLAEAVRGRAVAGCLRNAAAVARWLEPPVAVIAAGERWPDGTIRFALEDLLGAGAIIERLGGSRSPEAESAAAAFLAHRDALADALADTASGVELIERGYRGDIDAAAALNVDDVVPELIDGAFRAAT